MAFPIPSHLPRKPNPHDVSSQILSKIDAATDKSLNSPLAASWLVELEETIQSTKKRIHDRVRADLPKFRQQLESSKSVQQRLQSLTSGVDDLSELVSNPETGSIPTLVGNLTRHAALAQEAADAKATYESLSHLLECRMALTSLTTLIEAGKLSDAVKACEALESLLERSPAPLNGSNVMDDVKRKYRAAKARTEEQLSNAYSRSIIISSNEFMICQSVQVRQSDAVISLPSILSSLSPESLSNHLTALCRDLTTYFIDYALRQPLYVSATSSSTIKHKFTHFPSPPNEEIRTTRLENLSAIFNFLSVHLFPSLPPSHISLLTRSLSKPTVTSVLNHLLGPSLPSSFDLLPPFLDLVKRSVIFEEEVILGILGNNVNDRPVKAWADGASGHYERQRRLQILESSRSIIISPEDPTSSFRVEVETLPEVQPTVVPVQLEDDIKDDAWGFEDDVKSGTGSSLGTEDGWAFDEEAIQEPEPKLQPATEPEGITSELEVINAERDPDPADAWGWNDEDLPEAGEATEETAWDDPWSDEPSESSHASDSRPPPVQAIAVPPKVATRLEKRANKSKRHMNGTSPMNSPVTSSISSSEQTSSSPIPVPEQASIGKQPSKLQLKVPTESYLVSGRMKFIISIVEDVLNEGKQFTCSKVFPSSESGSAPGTIILQSAPSIFDLHRALYPVTFGRDLASSESGMRFSNDCLFLSDEIERIENDGSRSGLALVKERLSACKHRYRTLADSWYHQGIEKERKAVDKILTEGTQGLTYTGDQDRYDECESAISEALQEIRRLAQRLKGVLTKSKYYTAIGMVADAALSRVLGDVLALPDIPEVESHRLSELCRILNALENLFVEDPTQPSFVVAYVPSWLKFSYLSELLEASMADISYLFEEGALVDFEVEELIRLVRALFADTALRTTTINKLLCGHPAPLK